MNRSEDDTSDQMVDSVATEAGPAETPLDEKDAAAKRKPAKKKKALIGVAIAVVVVVVAGVGFYAWHMQPSFCGICHDTMGSYLEGYESGDVLAHAHAESGVVCLDCHEPEISEQVTELVTQVTGDYRLPLAKMDVEDDFCLRSGCHVREDIVARTADFTTDSGAVVNPHEMLFSPDYSNTESPHEQADATTIACKTCHTSHRASQGIDYCYSCHHAKVFDPCSSCHDHR